MSDIILPLQRLKPVNVLNHKSRRSPSRPDHKNSARLFHSRFPHPIPPAPRPAHPTSFQKADTVLPASPLRPQSLVPLAPPVRFGLQNAHAQADCFPVTPLPLFASENDEAGCFLSPPCC